MVMSFPYILLVLVAAAIFEPGLWSIILTVSYTHLDVYKRQTIPFSGDMEMGDVKEDQIPMVTVRLAHKDMEAKPDYDGEMRCV